MSKYAFIVDPFSSGALYAQALVVRGLTPVAILSQYPVLDIYKNSYKSSDFQYIFSYKGSDEILYKELLALLGNDKPALVLPGSECGVELADRLSSYFCPDSSNGSLLSLCRRNKFDMSQQLTNANVAVPLAMKSNSLEEVLAWSEKHNLLSTGVVIKPVNSAGTDGVVACFSQLEIEKAIKKNIGKLNQLNYLNEFILAQEYVAGDEYVIDTASRHGKHMVTAIWRYKKIQTEGARFVYDYVDFLPPDGLFQSELSQYIFTVLDSLGIQHGPAHSEVMQTNRGLRLIETGARLHGGVGIKASCLATGTSQLDRSLDLILNNVELVSNRINFELKNHTRIVFLISHFESTIISEHANLEKIKKLPSFSSMNLNLKPGDKLVKTIDFFSAPGILILSHPSEEQIEKDYQQVRLLEEQGIFIL